jgi:hypothetical protein
MANVISPAAATRKRTTPMGHLLRVAGTAEPTVERLEGQA